MDHRNMKFNSAQLGSRKHEKKTTTSRASTCLRLSQHRVLYSSLLFSTFSFSFFCRAPLRPFKIIATMEIWTGRDAAVLFRGSVATSAGFTFVGPVSVSRRLAFVLVFLHSTVGVRVFDVPGTALTVKLGFIAYKWFSVV